MLSVEEREAIDYLKSRLYENECCKFIDVPQNDLRIFLNLVKKLQKNFTLKNNKICNLEFIIEKQIEEMKRHIDLDNECEIAYISKIKNLENNDKKWKDKIKAKIEEVEQWELYNMKIPRLSTLDERLGAKIGIKYVLQSLLEKE